MEKDYTHEVYRAEIDGYVLDEITRSQDINYIPESMTR